MNRLVGDRLTKRYRGVPAIQGVDVEAAGGQLLVVLGASGSGKSTLVRLLHLLESPDQGSIRIDDEPVFGPNSMRRFSLVQQRPGLLRTSVLENVAFPLRARGVTKAEAKERSLAQLERVGLESKTGVAPSTLSGGEMQRVAVARALVTVPEFLLLDEATNQLDPANVRRVESLVKEQAQRGCAVVWVTHNVQQARRVADSFLFLENGRAVEAGDRASLDRPQTASLKSFLEIG